MIQSDALLRSILENPREDLPRLVYADWLDEAGEAERSEFIRLQCELARTAEPPITVHTNKPCAFGLADPKCPRCKFGLDLMREQELLRESGVKWIGFDAPNWQTEMNGAIGRVGATGKPRLIFARGFLSSVTLDWQTWLRHHDGLFWSPRQTTHCELCFPLPKHIREQCTRCPGNSRIPRPFVASCQPLETVRISAWPVEGLMAELIPGANHFMMPGTRYSFSRVKCGVCDGRAIPIPGYRFREPACDSCRGNPLNLWECEAWPGLEFVMPEMENRRV